MRISAKARKLFGENLIYLDGISNKRLHPYVDEGTAEKIRTESKLLGISISEYVLYTAFTFKTDDIPQKLDNTLKKLNQYMDIKGIKPIKKGDGITMTKRNGSELRQQDGARAGKSENEAGTEAREIEQPKKERNEQFHLRITQESYDEIKRRAAQFSMSLSDYIVFVTTHFDIMDISRKIDEINEKLDAVCKQEQKQEG